MIPRLLRHTPYLIARTPPVSWLIAAWDAADTRLASFYADGPGDDV